MDEYDFFKAGIHGPLGVSVALVKCKISLVEPGPKTLEISEWLRNPGPIRIDLWAKQSLDPFYDEYEIFNLTDFIS